MEPERPIEKVLRELAKRRRDEAGEPLEMHPATRRLLQAEIARQYTKRRRTDQRSFFARFSRAFAYAACLGVLILGAILLVPSPSTPKKNSKFASTSTDSFKDSSRMAEPVPGPSEAIPSDEIASAPRESAPISQEVRSSDLAKAKSNEEAPSKLADASSPTRRRDSSSAEGQAGPIPEPVAAPPVDGPQVAVNIPAAPPPSPPAGAAGVARERQQAFFQRQPVGKETGDKKLAANRAAEQAPVLLAFTVQQQGANLRFVDSDGSVYDGLVLTVTNAAVSQKPAAAGFIESAATSNGPFVFPFTVSGSNRTLREWVVFNGNFSNRQSALPIDGAARSETESDLLGVVRPAIPTLSSSNWTVTGTATIGSTNQIKVEAAPVTAPAKP
jgi:hypothetical protein